MPIVKRGRKYQATVNHKGERFRRSFETLADAETWESQTKLNLKHGRPVDLGEDAPAQTRGITLGRLRDEALLHHWSDVKDKRGPEMNTRIVCEFMGWDLPVTMVTSRRVEDMVLKMTQKGNSDSTINRKLSALSTMMRYALKHSYIPHMPDISRKREPEHRIRWMTKDEEAELIAFMEHIGQEDMADAVKVALDTGVRRGELLKLQARDIHEGKLYIWESKGGKARSVPLTDRAAAVLGKRVNRTERPTEKLWIDLSENSMRHYWDRARQHMGLTNDPQFTVHVMRHTFCSRLAQAGVAMPVIKELAGHSTIVTTQRYVHMSPDNLRDAIGVLNSGSGLQSADTPHATNGGATSGVAGDPCDNGNQKSSVINALGSGRY